MTTRRPTRTGADPSAPNPTDAADAPGTTRWRREVRAFGELFALSGLAIAQPVFDVFGRAPDHLLFRGADRTDIIAFASITVLAVPVALWVLEALTGLVSPRGRTWVHSIALWGLVAMIVVDPADTILTRRAALAAGALVATAFVLLHRRTRGPRIWLAFLTPAPIAFLALFLLASPIAPLLRDADHRTGAHVRDPTPTVVVILDAFPTAHLLDENADIDAELLPNLAALADTSTWFRQTTTVANATTAAVPAILTGIEPVGQPPATSETYPDNLFTLVADDMAVTVSERVTRLCPSAVCERIDEPADALGDLLADARDLLGRRLDPSDPDDDVFSRMADEVADVDATEDDEPDEDDLAALAADIEEEITTDRVSGRFDRFIDTIATDPGLHVIHIVLPHGPYRLLPDGTVYPLEEGRLGVGIDHWDADPTPAVVGRKRQLLQTQRVDGLIGHLRERLETTGAWDATNVLVVADHGMSFRPGNPARGVTADVLDAATDRDEVFAAIAWVPFFVKRAGQVEGAVSDDPVRNLDVTPTVADLLDVDIPWDDDGRSAFDGGSGDPDRVDVQFNDILSAGTDAGPDRGIDRRTGWGLVRDDAVARFAPADPPPPATDVPSGSARIFRIGPRPDLWGRTVPDDLPRIEVDVDDRSRADDVRLADGTVPALFMAQPHDVEVGTDVAVAVDGTVWATTSVMRRDDLPLVVAILPREAFHDGANTLSVHLLDPP